MQSACAKCGITKSGSTNPGAEDCWRDDGYNSRGNRFGKFYNTFCCTCATKEGFDLTIAGHGGSCNNCLAKNMRDLKAHPHLHLDTLCSKLSHMIYESKKKENTVLLRLQTLAGKSPISVGLDMWCCRPNSICRSS
mmetsp:Transcript_34494/g.55642  ORF Transcript_34494/g.55642 Transcript_34494/m.55642 type:complete len:136 (-) Transcript_34494:957-1364(-)